MPAFYYLDAELSRTHVPKHPDRTVYGGDNPFSVYYREFRTRPAMNQWLRHQSWESRKEWRAWMSVENNRILLAKRSSPLRQQNTPAVIQPSLFEA
jgi:hypothetical protein